MQAFPYLTCAGLLAALAPVLPAQDTPPRQGQDPNKPMQSTPMHPTAKQDRLMRFQNDFIGMQVVTSKGETLGKVEDVIIHPQGRVAYVQISGGGAAGPARHVPVPWTALTRNEQGQLVLNTTSQDFAKFPDYDKQPPLSDASWWSNVDRAYEKIESSIDRRASEASAPLPPVKALHLGSAFRTITIETPEGEKLGTVREVVFDPKAGRASYVVIALQDTEGTGGRLVAVPWGALRTMPDRQDAMKDRWTLSTTREKLSSAPEFQTSNEGWQTASDRAYMTRVYQHYNVAPYWSDMPSDARDTHPPKDKDKDKDDRPPKENPPKQ
jgi:sporulation protein YlmC with PRC-barrel domain